MKTIVVSAVNLRKGGTLAILDGCLQTLSSMARKGDYRIVAIVHKRNLANYEGIDYIELEWSVRSWLHRLWCEYVTMYGISKKIGDIDLWLSLHDTTPRVKARRQAVYCHNSYPFFRWKWYHLLLNYRIVCFALFTNFIYRANLYRNNFVIVQQEWFRKAFTQMFNLCHNQIIVFPPPQTDMRPIADHRLNDGKFCFIYPAYPDVHKNLECLCEAAKLLEEEVGADKFEVMLTIDRTANAYTRMINRKWGRVSSLRFCGFLSQDRLYDLYAQANCLVFPSKAETWGLPISEFAQSGRYMLLADLPYAHESAGGSKQTAFFNPEKLEELKNLMRKAMEHDIKAFKVVEPTTPKEPVARSWQELFTELMRS